MSFAHPKRERLIVPLFLTVFLDLLGLGIAIPVLAVLFIDPRVSILPLDTPLVQRTILFGFLTAAYPLAQFFGAPVLGALSDRFGRKPVIVLSLLGTFTDYLLFAIGIHWKHVAILFASRVIAGFLGGNLSTVMSAIGDYSEGKEKTRNYGLVGMAIGLGFILGPYVGGKLSDPSIRPWFGLTTPFLFAAGLLALDIILTLWLLHETLTERRKTPVSALTGIHQLIKAFSTPRIRTLFLTIFLLTLGFNFFGQFFQVFLIERFRFTQGDIGDFFAYIGLCVAITQGLVMRPVTKYFSTLTIFTWCTFLLSLVFPLLLLPTRAMGLYFIAPFLALFQGLSQPASISIVSDASTKQNQGEMMGINQAVQSMAMAIPPLIAGFIAGIHVSLPIIAACVLTVCGWLVFVLGFQENPQNKE